MTSHLPPTPDDLRRDPELAIFDVLDHTLKLAVYALVAIYPQLTDPERPFWLHEDSGTGRAAKLVVGCSEELIKVVCDYRTAILRDREEEINEALPF